MAGYYFTGSPCREGHICKRLMSGHCYECRLINGRKLDRARYEKRKTTKRIRGLIYKEYQAEYRAEHREKHKQYMKEYNKVNKNSLKAHKTGRKKHIKLATPKFANFTLINEIYTNCPEGYQVDHIIPLRNPNVCGLHVEYNLQYLTEQENRAKKNSFVII